MKKGELCQEHFILFLIKYLLLQMVKENLYFGGPSSSSASPNIELGCRRLRAPSADKAFRKCHWKYGWGQKDEESLRICIDSYSFFTFLCCYYLMSLHGNMGTRLKVRAQEQICPSLHSKKNWHLKLWALHQTVNSQGNEPLIIPSINKQINKRYKDLICLIHILWKPECRLNIVIWWLQIIQSYKQSMTIDDNVVSYIINAEEPLSSKTNSLEYFKPITNTFNADHCETMCVSLFLMLDTQASQEFFAFHAFYSFMLPILLTILVLRFEKSRLKVFQATFDAGMS